MYRYTVWQLMSIKDCYGDCYERGIWFYKRGMLRWICTDPFSCAEYKADFDMALKHIGRKHNSYITWQEWKSMRRFLNGEDVTPPAG